MGIEHGLFCKAHPKTNIGIMKIIRFEYTLRVRQCFFGGKKCQAGGGSSTPCIDTILSRFLDLRVYRQAVVVRVVVW